MIMAINQILLLTYILVFAIKDKNNVAYPKGHVCDAAKRGR